MDDWQPLSVRQGKQVDYDALQDGVPGWLVSSLWKWVDRELRSRVSGYLSIDLLHEIERRCRVTLNWANGGSSALATLRGLMQSAPTRFLDVVDFLLSKLPVSSYEAKQLDVMLTEAGSLWRVVRRQKGLCLEERVQEPIALSAERAMSRQGKAGRLLMLAWQAIYGRSPNPSWAYKNAVRAVEAAGQPIISPKNADATLGKMIAEFR
ncbi:MAG TPA: hypothetical protein VF660_12065, partial [Actinomycetota bacterium]